MPAQQYSGSEAICVFYVRPARNRARAVAAMEALSLLRDLEATAMQGGPLGEQGGLFWISLPERFVPLMRGRLPRLGYTSAVDLAQPVVEERPGLPEQLAAPGRLTR